MPRMNILNAVEREAFESPPVFNSVGSFSLILGLACYQPSVRLYESHPNHTM